jgi:DNA-binding NarL/FixJ family response regulator
MLRVLIADDHPLTREGVRMALDVAEDIELVGSACNGAELMPLIPRTDPDIVLLDIRMPLMDGLTCLELIRRRHPDVRVVMFSQLTEPDVIQTALKRGATGYIVKSIDPEGLASALRQAYAGTVFHALGAGEIDPEANARAAGLTRREIAILKAVARGLSNQAIAKELWVTEQTVKFHLTNVYRKIGAKNRTEAARCAYQLGLVEAPALDGLGSAFDAHISAAPGGR